MQGCHCVTFNLGAVKHTQAVRAILMHDESHKISESGSWNDPESDLHQSTKKLLIQLRMSTQNIAASPRSCPFMPSSSTALRKKASRVSLP